MQTAPKSAEGVRLANRYDASIAYRYIARAGHSVAEVCSPEYWHHLKRELLLTRQSGVPSFNEIEVLAEDGSFEVHLRVMGERDGRLILRVLWEWRETGRAMVIPEGYNVGHVAGSGWRVLDPYNRTIAERVPTERAAVEAAKAHYLQGVEAYKARVALQETGVPMPADPGRPAEPRPAISVEAQSSMLALQDAAARRQAEIEAQTAEAEKRAIAAAALREAERQAAEKAERERLEALALEGEKAAEENRAEAGNRPPRRHVEVQRAGAPPMKSSSNA